MRIAVFILICGFMANGVLAVDCPDLNYIFTTQAEIDAFGELDIATNSFAFYSTGNIFFNN